MEPDPAEGWLPPGQVATRRFPHVGEPTPPEARQGAAWRLAVGGLVARPLSLSLAEVRARPAQVVVADLHCVTGWSRRATRFGGFPLRDLLDEAGVLPACRFVRLAARSARGHDTSLPLDLARSGTWIVHTLDAAPLPPERGGPLRTLTPSRYLYKSLKWLVAVECLAEDRLGFWEREAGYHNRADPWQEQRFVTGDVKPADVARLRTARRLGSYRGRNLLGVDLAGWDPLDRDLRDLRIRGSDLRGARLAGADLRGANLSRSDLRGAALAGADLRGADLEGADLRGADLAGADLRGAALTATRLADAATVVTALRWTPGGGLLEEDEAFLRAAGGPPEA